MIVERAGVTTNPTPIERIQPVLDRVIGQVKSLSWLRFTTRWGDQGITQLVSESLPSIEDEQRAQTFRSNLSVLLGSFDQSQLELYRSTSLHSGHEFEDLALYLYRERRLELDRMAFSDHKFKSDQTKWD